MAQKFSKAIRFYVVDSSSNDNIYCGSDTLVQQTSVVMKIKMHYVGKVRVKGNTAACGMHGVHTTLNHREITCRKCLKTNSHKTTVMAYSGVTKAFD